MIMKTVNRQIEQAYFALKGDLEGKGCKITSEQVPNRIVAEQGSLWGTTPKTAKKTLDFNLTATAGGTQITCQSKLSSSWVNLTVIGTVLSIVLVGVCFWISTDIDGFLASRQPSFWSWIVAEGSCVDVASASAFAFLTMGLAFFLIGMVALEVLIAANAQKKVDTLAIDTLKN
jgi:hypothetical protein